LVGTGGTDFTAAGTGGWPMAAFCGQVRSLRVQPALPRQPGGTRLCGPACQPVAVIFGRAGDPDNPAADASRCRL